MFYAAILLALLGGFEVKSIGPQQAAVGDLVMLELKADGATAYAWELAAAPRAKTFLPIDGGRKIVFASGDPGTFVFVGAATNGKEVSLVIHAVELTVGGKPNPPPAPPAPPAPPDDGTTPPQPPAPDGQTTPVTATKLYMVIVEETANAVAERGQLLRDRTLAARVKAKGHKWRIVDQNIVGPDGKPPADVKPYLDLARGKGLPQIFLVTPAGKMIYQGNLPVAAPAFLQLIQKFGG